MKMKKISKATIFKIIVFIVLPIFLTVVVYYLYKNYFYDNNFINKYILKKDMEYKYFVFEEFDSRVGSKDTNVETYIKNGQKFVKDSGRNNMSPTTIKMLDDARDIVEREWNKLGKPKISFKINSGYRTPSRNEDEGGVPNSAHTLGYAVDISWRNYSSEQKAMIEKALKMVGFNRFGRANGFIHTDNDSSKPKNANWTY